MFSKCRCRPAALLQKGRRVICFSPRLLYVSVLDCCVLLTRACLARFRLVCVCELSCVCFCGHSRVFCFVSFPQAGIIYSYDVATASSIIPAFLKRGARVFKSDACLSMAAYVAPSDHASMLRSCRILSMKACVCVGTVAHLSRFESCVHAS